MKIILDTNVFVSGIFFSGPSYEILKVEKDRRDSASIFQERRSLSFFLLERPVVK